MRKTFAVLLLILFACTLSHAQERLLKGQVVDSKTKAPLAFVSIAVKNTTLGTSSDINGKFSLKLPGKSCELVVSAVGFDRIVYACNALYQQGFLIVPLVEKVTDLQEVVIRPKENPAFRIIRLAVKNKSLNDPSQIPAFRYNTYNKLIATLKGFDSDADLLETDSSMNAAADSSGEKLQAKGHFL